MIIYLTNFISKINITSRSRFLHHHLKNLPDLNLATSESLGNNKKGFLSYTEMLSITEFNSDCEQLLYEQLCTLINNLDKNNFKKLLIFFIY